MRTALLTTYMAGAIAFVAAPALAQSSGGASGAASGSAAPSSGSSTQAGSSTMPMPKAMTQAKVQQVMKDAGFTDVTIMDAAYLVQATTKDGDQILVLLNAPMMQAAAARTGSTSGGASGSSGGSGGASGSTTAPKQ